MNRKQSSQKAVLGLLVMVLLVVSACAPTKPVKPTRYFWPVPPEVPRLEFLKNYYTVEDLPKSGMEAMLGQALGSRTVIPMEMPFSIAVNSRGLVYISDGTRGIRTFDFEKSESKYLNYSFSTKRPMGLFVDSQDNLYFADGPLKMVLKVSPGNKLLATYGSKDIFENPTHVTVDEQRNRLYASDPQNNQIHAFDLQSRQHLFSFGRNPDEPRGTLYGPQGLAVNGQGEIIVCDMLNNRIVRFDSEGHFLSAFGQLGDAIDKFEFPKDLTIDTDGNLHILDSRKAALLTYTQGGKLLLYTGWGKRTTQQLGFLLPAGVWYDKRSSKLYIADAVGRRFGVWRYFTDDYIKKNPDFWK